MIIFSAYSSLITFDAGEDDVRIAVSAAAACAATMGLVICVAMMAVTGSPASASSTSPCITSGALPGLDTTQAANARAVIATAESVLRRNAAVIAVMTAYDESGLRVLGNPAVTTSGLPVQGSGSNADSIGLFQQRASWGTVAQRLDPIQSTRLFVQRLQKVDRWEELEPWQAAQAVQISAWDGHPRAANGTALLSGATTSASRP